MLITHPETCIWELAYSTEKAAIWTGQAGPAQTNEEFLGWSRLGKYNRLVKE